MTSIAKALAAAALLGASAWASASTTAINLFAMPGVPAHVTIPGPCYCDQGADFFSVLLLAPGTYDFGTVSDYWVQSGPTPDGGPDQPALYLLFAPWEAVGTYPGGLPPPPSYALPSSTTLCAQDDVACNAGFIGLYQDTRLMLTVGPGDNAVQIGFIGPYVYTPPLPEPSGVAMFVLGLALVGAASRRRLEGRRAR